MVGFGWSRKLRGGRREEGGEGRGAEETGMRIGIRVISR
jgi:hypothetical protein